MNTHEEKKMFKCICGKEFRQKGNLNAHYKKHFITRKEFCGDDRKDSPHSTFINDVNEKNSKSVRVDNANIINNLVNINCDFDEILNDNINDSSLEFSSNGG